ncbi:MAG: hypothetical protein JWL83_2458 [Actinomycetia bacterium]|nr:hypothetical protein [Actinomycetes bacterium]
MGSSPIELARQYRDRVSHRGAAPAELVGALAQRYRARRWHRLDTIVTHINSLPTKGAAPDARAAEALEYAAEAGDDDSTRDDATNSRWRAACFDVLVRDALNAGERIADLRLRPGQRAVLVPTETSTTLGVTASPSAPWAEQQQRALDDLAQLRDVVSTGAATPTVVDMAPLPVGAEWHELVAQLATRRSWRSSVSRKT